MNAPRILRPVADSCVNSQNICEIVTFQPGRVGYVLYKQDRGKIRAVKEGTQAQKNGIRVGWRLLKVGERDFTTEVLLNAMKGETPYEVTFLTTRLKVVDPIRVIMKTDTTGEWTIASKTLQITILCAGPIIRMLGEDLELSGEVTSAGVLQGDVIVDEKKIGSFHLEEEARVEEARPEEITHEQVRHTILPALAETSETLNEIRVEEARPEEIAHEQVEHTMLSAPTETSETMYDIHKGFAKADLSASIELQKGTCNGGWMDDGKIVVEHDEGLHELSEIEEAKEDIARRIRQEEEARVDDEMRQKEVDHERWGNLESSDIEERSKTNTMSAVGIILFILLSFLCLVPDSRTPSIQGSDVLVEVPSIHEAYRNNRLNIRATSVTTLETPNKDIGVLGILGFSYNGMSALAASIRQFTAGMEGEEAHEGRRWVFVEALLPRSRTEVGVERHLQLEDKVTTVHFLLALFTTISDILVLQVDDYNWLEQLFVFRYYETRGVMQRNDLCRDPLILRMSDTDTISERGNALRTRLRTCIGQSVRVGSQLQDVLFDAVSKSLRSIIDSSSLRDGEAKVALNLSYQDSGIRLFNDVVPSRSVAFGAGEHHAMNVYEIELIDIEGSPCRDRIVEIEVPGAHRNEFQIQTSDGHLRLRRMVSGSSYEIDLPFEKAWNVNLEQRFAVQDGILTLAYRVCP